MHKQIKSSNSLRKDSPLRGQILLRALAEYKNENLTLTYINRKKGRGNTGADVFP